MATIKEFKKWLDRFPDDTIVEFGIQQRGTGYESYGPVEFQTANLNDRNYGDGWDFLDFRKIKTSDHFGKSYLQIGEAN